MLGALLAVACLPRDEDLGRESKTRPKADTVSQNSQPKPQAQAGERNSEPKKNKAARPSQATSSPDPMLTQPFSDGFERPDLGPDWRATSAAWRIDKGRLCGRGARNHPVWLARRLPVDARIEFDAMSRSPHGDIKAEYWGDGRSAASGVSYQDATSYLTIFGGWKNHFHVLARLDEHAKDRLQISVEPSGDDPRAKPVVAKQSYHFKVERRDGKRIHWSVDGLELLALNDDEPLSGPGHEHFGFNDWEVEVCFDNLEITPL